MKQLRLVPLRGEKREQKKGIAILTLTAYLDTPPPPPDPSRCRRVRTPRLSVTISPSSPKRGEPVSMKATGTLTKPMSAGSYTLGVKLGSSEVYKHDGSLCGDSDAKVLAIAC